MGFLQSLHHTPLVVQAGFEFHLMQFLARYILHDANKPLNTPTPFFGGISLIKREKYTTTDKLGAVAAHIPPLPHHHAVGDGAYSLAITFAAPAVIG